MALGFSTQTRHPLPHYFWFSSSHSFWASSKMAPLLRQSVCTFQSAKNHFLDIAIVSSSAINQSSSHSNTPFDKNSRFRDARKRSYFSVQPLQDTEEHAPATSGDWLKLSKNMNKEKMKVHNSNDTAAVVNGCKEDKLKNLDALLHTSNLEKIAITEAQKNLVDPAARTNEAQFNLQRSSPRQHTNIEGQRTHGAKNEVRVNANGSSGAASSGNNSNSRTPKKPVKKNTPPRRKTPVVEKPVKNSILTAEVEKPVKNNILTPEVEKPAQVNGLSGNHHSKQSVEMTSPDLQKDPPALDKTHIKKMSADEANGHLCERLNRIFDEVLVVDTVSLAEEIVGRLTNQYRHLVHACDTEVAGIDVKQDTPVDHGEIICFSIYSGPEANFGNGKSCIWVDVLDGGGRGMLAIFAPFFEDPSIKKVWHNYSFDNHVIESYGLKLSGFHADTMHMARLWDSSRRIMGGYSLEALTSDQDIMSAAGLSHKESLIGKISMKTIFGRRKLKKNGSEGKIITIPPVEELQRVKRKTWVCYSALDSKSTLKLYESLKKKLASKNWELDGVSKGSMFDFYVEYWRPFGELLVKMETEGMLVDRPYLAEIEKVAKVEQQIAADRFRNWASKQCPDAKYMNVGSDTQLRQLFFGGIMNRAKDEILPVKKDFKVPNVDKIIEEGKKVATKFRKITLHKIGEQMETELYTASGWPSMSGAALKALSGKVSAEYEFTDEALQPDENDDEMPAELVEIISTEAPPDTSAYGSAYSVFGGGSKGIEACHAIAALCEVCSIDSLISNFILPLQGSHISGNNGRIHCSLNINTETGRLSARRPNLQNQPALEKDRYKIRQAFIASLGNSLIVADYGQLELRILAHLANCKSMLDAFKAGGDFHSRTAMNMYPYIRDAVEKKDVLLEWYPQPGQDKPPVPLLKDAFASERRKAKMLNFSIAYGKTTIGLARDWKVSLEEAEETVNRWYSERKEVLKWQEIRKKEARDKGFVRTLLGRSRKFPSFRNSSYAQKGHIERAAINTPVQGSAADVAMCAMLEIVKNTRLKELGWKLLLQVHDEVILEGPTESAEEAKVIVVQCMSKPFDGKNILRVDLSVDAKFAQNWYSAK